MWTGPTYCDPIVIKDDYKKMEDAISSEEKSATPNCRLRRPKCHPEDEQYSLEMSTTSMLIYLLNI